MRYLRSSIYASPVDPPVTTVAGEDGMTDTLESIRHSLLEPGLLIIHEIFEASDSLEAATVEAARRQQANAEQEAHQAMLYYWTVSQWHLVTAGGTLLMDKPAPLSREEIEVVFAQLAQHPDYRGIHIISHTRTGEMVELVNGKIKEG